MRVLDTIAGLLAPHSCLVCGDEGDLLCADCSQRLPPAPSACFRCLRTTTDYLTCDACRIESGVLRVWRATPYSDAAKELVWRLKFTGARSAAAHMADVLQRTHIPENQTVIIPVPTATSRVRQRGYDQAALLARAYAKRVSCRYLPCLARHGQQHQRGAGRRERLVQLAEAYRLKHGTDIKGLHVLLVDDVATTGASLQAAAQVLLAAGAATVEAIVFAQA